jgi:GH15 family glucan-1,4-alpha-glucosidase
MPLYWWNPMDLLSKDPKYISTVKAIERELCFEGLLYRYKKGWFWSSVLSTICTFWFINSLQAKNRRGAKKAKKNSLINCYLYSTPRAFSEDIDFETKTFVG